MSPKSVSKKIKKNYTDDYKLQFDFINMLRLYLFNHFNTKVICNLKLPLCYFFLIELESKLIKSFVS